MRQVQGTMSLIEGYSNLVMNELGARLLPGFDKLEEAYKLRSANKGVLDQLVWKFTGLDLKLQQYRRGEAFARAVFDAHGMKVLNLAWEGPDKMPRLEELGNPERWYRRVAG
jgi:putative hydrolase